MKFIYFIRADGLDRIKIGCSKNPASRVDVLQKAAPVDLSLVCFVPGDERTENFLHSIFAASRKAGEWFASSLLLEELVAVVKSTGALPCWAGAPRGWRIKVVDDRGLKISAAIKRSWAAKSPAARKAFSDNIKRGIARGAH